MGMGVNILKWPKLILSRVKGFKPNKPLRGIMDRTQTSVHVFEKHESRIEKLVHRKYNKILLQK